MATAREKMEELHKLVANSLSQRIKKDIEDEIPTDAATLSAAIKFLKDNDVTADPASREDLTTLRDKLTEQRNARKGNVLKLAKSDVKNIAQG